MRYSENASMGLGPHQLNDVEFTVNLAANLAASLAATGADIARTTGLIIGAAVFLLAGVTLLVAMRFRATRNRDTLAEGAVVDAEPTADDTK